MARQLIVLDTQTNWDSVEIPLGKIAGSGAVAGQVPIWNGTEWIPGAEIVEATSEAEETEAFAAGAKIVIRTDLL